MIALGCDHGGFALKQVIMKYLESAEIPWRDYGTDSEEAVDYPEYAVRTARAVIHGECEKGILLCGTGIGISIAANRIPGIRAALCHDVFSAEACRAHNDANILVMGGRVIGPGPALAVLRVWLDTPFSKEERHIRRIRMIEEGLNGTTDHN